MIRPTQVRGEQQKYEEGQRDSRFSRKKDTNSLRLNIYVYLDNCTAVNWIIIGSYDRIEIFLFIGSYPSSEVKQCSLLNAIPSRDVTKRDIF